MQKPDARPRAPQFSSGPCAKRPGWNPEFLGNALIGRSHRAKPCRARIKAVLDQSREILGIPDDYRLAIVPASDTGAVEMALWSLLGARGVDLLAWESFGLAWVNDVVKQLRLDDARVMEAPYGALPDLGQVDWSRDVVFVWNGTTSGVRVPDGDWIADDRDGLAICDATSAVYAMDVPFWKLDVVTWSWQKVLGGEGAHGMLALSPRAVARLESYTPPWPMPKIFRLTKGGKLDQALFEGATINTPSMLAIEDVLGALDWARSVGGLAGLIERSEANLAELSRWVELTPWIDFLAGNPAIRSNTSACLRFVDPWFDALSPDRQFAFSRAVAGRLADEGAAFDIESHRDSPPGLRVWCGATVEQSDIKLLTPWLEWAYETERAGLAA